MAADMRWADLSLLGGRARVCNVRGSVGVSGSCLVHWSRLEVGVLLPQEVRCFLKLEDEWESQMKEEWGDSYRQHL